MPDPINMSQEDQDRLAAEMRGGISQGPLAKQAIEAQNIANANQAVASSDAPVGGSIIPPVTTTVGENIDQTVNPGGVSAQDLATIQQAKSLYEPAPQIPVTPTPSNAALMPTLNQPINVGTSSGQIIGSHGVYVDPGFVAPWGAMMQKKAAQDEQTNLALKQQHLAKKARDKAFKFEKPKFKVKDPGFQKNLNETATSTINSYTDQAKELYGQDWQAALKTDTRLGREFQSAMDGLNVVARNADLMTDKFAEIKAGIKDGSTYYDPGVLEAFREYEQAMGRFEKGDVTALAGMRQKLERIDGEMELNNFLNDSGILSNVVAEVTGGTGISGMQDFMKLRTTDRKSYDKNINAMVKNVRKAKGLDSSYTEADIRNALEGHFQNKSKSKTTLKSKSKGGRGGLKIDPANTVFQEGNKPVVVSSVDSSGNRTESTYDSVSALPMPQKKGGVKFEGAKSVDSNGNLHEIADIVSLNPVSSQVMEYTEDGETKYKKVVATEVTKEQVVMVPGKDEVLGETLYNNDGTVKMVPHKDGKKETVTETIMLDAESSEDQLRDKYGDDYYDQFEKNYSKFSNPSSLQQAISEFGQAKYNQLSAEMKKEFDNTYK